MVINCKSLCACFTISVYLQVDNGLALSYCMLIVTTRHYL